MQGSMATQGSFEGLAPTIAGPQWETCKPRLALPPDSCDCHVHIFGPQRLYPHAENPGYIPHECSTADLWRMLDTIGCSRAVLVQPSYYGTDNRCLVDALQTSPRSFRGVAGVDDRTSDAELERLHEVGVRGIRLHLRPATLTDAMERAERLAARVRSLGWHLQFQFYAESMPHIDERLARLPVDVVIDHIGYVPAAKGLSSPGFQALVRLARTGKAWFKLSAPYRQSNCPPDFPDVVSLVHTLLALAPDRCVWATDWPHASRNDGQLHAIPNDGNLVDLLLDWIADEAQRKRILVDNPSRLYDFPSSQ